MQAWIRLHAFTHANAPEACEVDTGLHREHATSVQHQQHACTHACITLDQIGSNVEDDFTDQIQCVHSCSMHSLFGDCGVRIRGVTNSEPVPDGILCGKRVDRHVP